MTGARLRVLAVSLATLALPRVAAAQPLGTAFTYQGRLTDGAAPATGSFDFRFTLFDAAVGGNTVGAPATANGVAVAQGLFSSVLDFGPAAFAGQSRWLQVEVRPAGGSTYTTLAPRQPLSPAPYAVFSSFTDPANLTSLNASNLTAGTVPGARLAGTYGLTLNLSNGSNTISGTFTGVGTALTGLNASNLASGTVPSAAVSGTYSNALNLSNPVNVFVGDGAGLTNLNAQPRFLRTVVVRPVGTSAQNGAALLAALAGITTASGANPWLLKIEPGVFDLGAGSLVMKPFVDVEGSGEGVTVVTALGRATNDVGTVHAVTNSELRALTVENRGGDAFAKALFVDTGSPRITHVTAVAFNAANESQAFYAHNGATPTVQNLTANAFATGTANSFGVLSVAGAGSVFYDLNARATGGAFARAVASYVGAAPIFRRVVAIGSGATVENQGLASFQSSPTYEDVIAIATGNATNNLGCLSFGTPSNVFLRHANCRAIGATSINYGVLNNGGANVTIVELAAEAAGGTNARGVENNGAGGGTTITHARVLGVGGTTEASGLLNTDSSPRIVEVEAYASAVGGGYAQGVGNVNASPRLLHVTATAAGQTGIIMGVNNGPGSSAVLEHVSANASGGNFAYGVVSQPEAADRPVLRAVTANAFDGANFTIGVFTVGAGVTSLTDVVASATGATGTAAGLFHDTGTIALTGVTSTAAGSAPSRYGLVNNGGTTTTTVDRSTLTGPTASIQNGTGAIVRVAGSKLVGPATNSGTTMTCLFSYNGSFAALNVACQ